MFDFRTGGKGQADKLDPVFPWAVRPPDRTDHVSLGFDPARSGKRKLANDPVSDIQMISGFEKNAGNADVERYAVKLQRTFLAQNPDLENGPFRPGQLHVEQVADRLDHLFRLNRPDDPGIRSAQGHPFMRIQVIMADKNYGNIGFFAAQERTEFIPAHVIQLQIGEDQVEKMLLVKLEGFSTTIRRNELEVFPRQELLVPLQERFRGTDQEYLFHEPPSNLLGDFTGWF